MGFLINLAFVVRVSLSMLLSGLSIHPRFSIPLIIAFGLPSFLVNLGNLVAKAGCRRTLKEIKRYPQILMSPVFTPFLFTFKTDETKGQDSTDDPERATCWSRFRKRLKQKCLCCTSNSTNKKIDHDQTIEIWRSASCFNFCYMFMVPLVIPDVYGIPSWRIDAPYEIMLYILCFSVVSLLIGLFAYTYFYGFPDCLKILCKSCKRGCKSCTRNCCSPFEHNAYN